MDKTAVTSIFLEALKEYDVSPHVDLQPGKLATITFAELALDSLDLLQLAMDLETELEIEIEVDEIARDATIDEFIDFLIKLPKSAP